MLAAHGQYRPDNIFIETVGFLWIVGNMPGARAGYKNNSADRAPHSEARIGGCEARIGGSEGRIGALRPGLEAPRSKTLNTIQQ